MWSYSLLVFEAVLLIWYTRFFLRSIKAWESMPENESKGSSQSMVTVLIAMRNEHDNLLQLFDSLSAQSYKEFEVVLIDDHSTDGSFELANELAVNYPFLRCLKMGEKSYGKKSALAFGVTQANANWILCTDADCLPQEDWIRSMLEFAENFEFSFVSGPVQFISGDSWFSRWQALEFSGLISLGAAAIFRKAPSMCNGANILYRKDVFLEIGGYAGNENIASGDDQFLMHRIFRKDPDTVGFCKDKSAIVYTNPLSSWKNFVSQRIRWASKNGQFERKVTTWEMIGVWMVSFIIILNLTLAFIDLSFLVAAICVFLVKGTIEYYFYSKTLTFYQANSLKKSFWLSELFQVFYVFCIGLLGKFVRYEWKGRK